jgi:2-dehydro-3-deoxygluconokinase
MTNRRWLNRKVIGIGEAMVEFAPIGTNVYQRGFAGDTLNTCWHIAKLLKENGRVGYCTRVGTDPFSAEFLQFLGDHGLATDAITRDPSRLMGLYVISLSGAERSFAYWRNSSAARGLADDATALLGAVEGAGLIHISGITLAVMGEQGRRNLLMALDAARSKGSIVSYDPNARRQLWQDMTEMRRALQDALQVTDIALPSFDDEAALWGDPDPHATLERFLSAGVPEVVVKNGSDAVALSIESATSMVPTPEVSVVRDTTGAGDAFNAGYLSGRLVGMDPIDACRFGQAVAGEIIGHIGALAPEQTLERFQSEIRERVTEG